MSIQKIMEGELADLGVSSLPDRPSAPSLYSGETLTAAELRAAFDRLPRLLAQRFNALLDATGLYEDKEGAETLASLIATGLAEGHSLQDLFEEIQNGVLADRLILDGERSLSEVLAALEDTISIPEGFESWKEYINSPLGEITTDETLPVSGGAVFRHTAQMENDIRESIPPTEGRVVQGDPLPVAGGRVYDALEGVTKPLDGRLSSMEGALDGTYFHFETITDLTTKQAVPEDAMTYARIDEIDGLTKASTNRLALLPNTELGTGTNGYDTSCDYHVWVDENGYLCIDSGGNDTGISSILSLPGSLFKNIPDGATVSTYVRYVSGSANGGYAAGENPHISFPFCSVMDVAMTDGATFTETKTFGTDRMMQAVGCFDNLKLAVTVVEGSTPVDEPVYYEGFKSAKVTAVKSYGKNLYDGDAEITLNGAYDVRILCRPDVEGTTHFSFNMEGTYENQGGIFKIVFTDGTEFIVGPTTLDTALTFTKKIRHIQLVNWALCVGRIYDIQLERGSTATEYKPYVGLLDTYTVPSEVQALEGYGIGISQTNNNGIDFASKTYTSHTYIEAVLDGTEDWHRYSSDGSEPYFYLRVGAGGSIVANAIVSDRYPSAVIASGNKNKGIYITNSSAGDAQILIRPADITDSMTVADFKATLAAVPITVMYVKSGSETETDIAPFLPSAPFLVVEGGGTVEAANEYGLPVSLTVTYQIKHN